MERRKTGLLVNIAYYGVIAFGVFLTLRYLVPVLLPFAAAFLISAVMQKPVDVLARRFGALPRKAVAFAVLAGFYAFFGVAFSLIFRALATQLTGFLSSLPSVLSNLAQTIMDSSESWLRRLPAWLRGALGGDTQQLLLSAVEALSAPLLELLGTAGSAAIKLPSAAFVIFITILCSFFIIMDYEGARRILAGLCPSRAKALLAHTRRRAAQAAVHLLKTYGTLMLITFGELWIGLNILNLLGAGINYVTVLSLVISLVDILPVLGVGTVLIPWALAVLVSGNSRLCIMLLTLCGVMYIIRNILESRLVGHRFGLHPALTLLALYVGGKWFGIAGIFLLPLGLIIFMQLRQDGVFEHFPDVQSG